MNEFTSSLNHKIIQNSLPVIQIKKQILNFKPTQSNQQIQTLSILEIHILMATNFNPQLTAEEIRSKSFLNQKDTLRQTTGSVFFRDNKVRSCSYVKETANGFKAVPFYYKRDNTLYPTPSTVTKSWNSTTYAKPKTVYAGMGTQKPLHAYDPFDARNTLAIAEFRPPHLNSSKIEIGSRTSRDTKHYVTTYANSFINKPKCIPTNHPGIQAFRNKWVRSRLSK